MNLLYKLQQSFGGTWAIHEPSAKNYFPLVRSILNGETKSFAELRSSYQRPKASYYKTDSMSYYDFVDADDIREITENVFVEYPIKGVMMKDSGMCSIGTNDMKRALMRLGENENVKGVVLNVDSPGGSVDGTESFSNFISSFSERYQKPIVAVMDGLTASAAMWSISGVDRIFVKDNTTTAGSIGTLVAFNDFTEWEEKQGIKQHVVRATKSFNKSVVIEEYLQGNDEKLMKTLDHANEIFLKTVQANRPTLNTSVVQNETPIVLSGEVFEGREIIKMGLADQMGGVEDAMKWLERENKKRSSNTPNPQTKDIQPQIGANNSNNYKMKSFFKTIAAKFGITSLVTDGGESITAEEFEAKLPETDMREDIIKEIVSKELKEAQTSQPRFDELKELINAQNEAIESMKATQQELTQEIAALKGQPKVVAKDTDGEIPSDIDYASAEATDAGQFAKKMLQAGAMTKEQYNAELAKIAKQQG